MAQNAVDCCNSALQKLGAASIVALDANTREARQCSIAYDSNRRSELRKHRWNFAIKRAVLSPDAETPAFDYTYQFTLPADCLRILRPNTPGLDWVVEGRKILTNDGNRINLRYIADITDVTQWDPAFYDMLAISLAIDMCEAITNSTSKKAKLDDDYEDAMRHAKRNNAFEQLTDQPVTDDFLLVRL